MTDGPHPRWEQVLWDLLCAMYQRLGGDCADLEPLPDLSVTIGQVKAFYDANGDPTFNTEQERLDFLALLDDTEAHLALPGNNLSDADNGIMTTMIADMRAGANPNP